MPAPNLDQIDSVLRLTDPEVWIVTAAAEGQRGGLTATWVSSASIDRQRPVLLVGLAANHFTTELVERSRAFVAHLLRSEQAPLAFDFARDSGRQRDKLAELALATTPAGSPVIADCLAWLDCRVFARYDSGERWFYWADIVSSGRPASGTPLKEKSLLSSLTPDQRQVLMAGRQADLEIQRPMHAAWRAGLDKAGHS